MRTKSLLWAIIPAIASATGCVYTHHPAIYSAVTTDAALATTPVVVTRTPTTVVATSPRPAVRVYAEPSSPLSITTPVPPPVTTTTVPGNIITTTSSADAA